MTMQQMTELSRTMKFPPIPEELKEALKEE
jgi:hypothetical protein